MVTRSCEQGRHESCGGLTATPLIGALLVHTCACLCHAGSATDDSLEQLLMTEAQRCARCAHAVGEHRGPGGECEGRDENRGGFPALIACECRSYLPAIDSEGRQQ